MKRIGLVMLMSAAATLHAAAAPWTLDTFASDGVVQGQLAYQLDEGQRGYALAYECDAEWGEDAIFIQTAEAFDATTSYAPEVPTLLTIDGEAHEHSGNFQQRDGLLAVYFDPAADPEMLQQLRRATGSIEVALFDKQLRFSGEGAEAALRAAIDGCGL